MPNDIPDEVVEVIVVSEPAQETVNILEEVVEYVEISMALQGPPGDKGEPGESSSIFIHDQTTPDTVWFFTHTLGRLPASIMIYDSDGKIVGADPQATAADVTISFSNARTGKVIIS